MGRHRRQVGWLGGATIAAFLVLALLLHSSRSRPPATPHTPAVATRHRVLVVPAAPPPLKAARSPSRSAPSPAPPSPPVDQAFEVLTLGPGNWPLPGVLLVRKDAPSVKVTTGEHGFATFPSRQGDKKIHVYASGVAPGGEFVLRPGRTVLRFPDLLPLEVDVVDADTGEGIGGASVGYWHPWSPLPLDYHGARFELPVSPIRQGRQESVALTVKPPPGYVTEEPGYFRASGTISAFAKRVEITVPLFREARLTAEVVEADGTPAAGAKITGIRMDGRNYPVSNREVPASGRILLPAVPGLRGEPVVVTAAKDGRVGKSKPARLGPPDMPVTVQIRLPATRNRGSYSRGALRSGAFGVITVDCVAPPSSGSATLRVRVVRRDGSPAEEARISIVGPQPGPWPMWSVAKRAGPTGTLTLSGLPAGSVTVTVREPGFSSPAPTKATLKSGRATEVTVTEVVRSPVSITVFDEQGQPLPGARISVEKRAGVAYAHLVGDRQELTILTDPDGRVVLDDLPPGKVEITATYGSRKATGSPGPDGKLVLRLPSH